MVNLDKTQTAQFHPWLDVDDADGSVGIIYYSAEEDKKNNKVVYPVYAQFRGGDPSNRENWSNERIGNHGSNIDLCGCKNGVGYRDYIGIHKQSHCAHLAWTSIVKGEPEVFYGWACGK